MSQIGLIHQVFSLLPGEWDLKRRIEGFGHMRGKGIFTLVRPDSIEYQESGVLTTGDGQTFKATRQYLYVLEKHSEQDEIAVYFVEDGVQAAAFHTFDDLKSLDINNTFPIVTQGYHLCIRDEYRAEYRFNSRDEFILKYLVNGPKKNYVSTTQFSRLNS